MRLPDAAHGFESALVDGAARHADVKQRTDDSLAQPADRNTGLELGNSLLEQLVMQRTLRRPAQEARGGTVDTGGGLQLWQAVDREEGALGHRLARLPPRIERGDDLP